MADLFGISVSALQAFQTAISVTGNNIANANTAGYAEESVSLTEKIPQSNGGLPVGSGVDVSAISRAVDALSNSQLNSSQSSLGQLNSLQTYTNQLDNIIGTTAGGLTTALQNYYNAWSTLSNDPTSTSARQALISQAQSVASAFQTTNTQLQSLNTGINSGIQSDVTQINSLASSISTLNGQIVTASAQSGGQAPNELLDQRDAALSSLSKLVGVTTSTSSDGSLNVFIANGQPLVLEGSTTQLTTVASPFNASQLELSTSSSSGNIISSQITSGDLGGLLAARTQAVNPAINEVGQIATAFASSANTQQSQGTDLNGQVGANLFSVAGPTATSSSKNTGTATAGVSIGNVGALTANNYLLSYTGAGYSLTNATTGATVPFTNTGTNQISADGLNITLSATPKTGDQFLIQPTAQAAGSFSVALTDPTKVAAAAALQSTAASTNAGSATIASPTVVTSTNANLLNATTITFSSPTQYTVNGSTTVQTLPANGVISLNGWQTTITGTPSTGDAFTIKASSTGDNRNALASASQQTLGVLGNGTTSINAATASLVTAIGSQAQQVNTAQTAQSAVNTQALAQVQSVSGVNLDEEAANLLKWQQAYAASAQALAIGNQTFQTFLSDINGS